MLFRFFIFSTVLVLGLLVLLVLVVRKTVREFRDLRMHTHEAFKKLRAEKVAMYDRRVAEEVASKTRQRHAEDIIKALEEKVKNRSVDLEKAIAATQFLKAQLHAKELEVAELKEALKPKKKITRKRKAL